MYYCYFCRSYNLGILIIPLCLHPVCATPVFVVSSHGTVTSKKLTILSVN